MRSWLRGALGGRSARADPASTLERAIAEHRVRHWEQAELLFRAVIDDPRAARHDRHVARNILGNLLERTRRLSEAIEVYEANVAEGFAGSYPYERLAAIYQQRGQPAKAAGSLERAVAVVERELIAGRDVAPQLERLRAALTAVTDGPPAG
jgi:tetratricopeptide (TPR) repeat protein